MYVCIAKFKLNVPLKRKHVTRRQISNLYLTFGQYSIKLLAFTSLKVAKALKRIVPTVKNFVTNGILLKKV